MKNNRKKLIALSLVIVSTSMFLISCKGDDSRLGKMTVEELQSIELTDEMIAEIESSLPTSMKEDLVIKESTDESKVLNIIHGMTHQKIASDKKWGAIPLTEKNVQVLYDFLETKNFNNQTALMNIVTKWKKKDFSEIDKDHNYIWNIQGGTVGKAYGILSLEEERKYIKKNFSSEAVQIITYEIILP